jgi:H+/Cl- antiporter ClcA
MYDELLEYLGVGIITMVVGALAINIILDEDKRKQYNTVKTYIILFIVGIVIHFIVQQLNLDTIYCGKKCQARIIAKATSGSA